VIGSPVILLDPADTVAVSRRDLAAGERLTIRGKEIIARDDVPLGHKIALQFIVAEATVVKHGMAIGSATRDIQSGEWVHLHNMRSNYISSHTRASKVRT
jgi:hypothetical protein